MSMILIVEDDAPLREAMSYVLAREGYGVLTASDGKVALEIVEDSSPGLILLDIYLPILDGRRFAQAYRQRPEPHAPILVITGTGYAAQRAAALEAAGYLAKPFTPRELLTKVKELVGPPPNAQQQPGNDLAGSLAG